VADANFFRAAGRKGNRPAQTVSLHPVSPHVGWMKAEH